jgi:hypothetical protein
MFGFVIFWHKNIGAKGARKMLMKLTPVVNFTNNLLHMRMLCHSTSISPILCQTLPLHSTTECVTDLD